MNIEKILNELTLEEKVSLLEGKNGKESAEIPRLGIKSKVMVDGPHGVRTERSNNAVYFPNLCCIGASWDKEMLYKMGTCLAKDCIYLGIDMLIAPGINLKRYILCGRNFEYISEDPVHTGEMAASYIDGVQSLGVGTCLKHFAANNQELDRLELNAEIDLRTLHELYFKGFEIAVKKSNPTSVMCAYNKLNAIWCSENKYLLEDTLKKRWGYDGFFVSDWGAVRNITRSIRGGIDMTMPPMEEFRKTVIDAVNSGELSKERIDDAAKRVLLFAASDPAKCDFVYDRKEQHKAARELAASGIVLLKNEGNVLPLDSKKYKKIAVIGGYAKNPIIGGQGSAEVYPEGEYIDSPLDELKKLMPLTEFTYDEIWSKDKLPCSMLWPMVNMGEITDGADAVIFFIGAMECDDTEQFDKNSPKLNPAYEYFIKQAVHLGKKVVVVMQTGGAVVIDKGILNADAIVEMWYGGEAAGGAIADVLTGAFNPYARLSETFPSKMRDDMQYSGNLMLEYNEKLDVGYRYYDKHPDEIIYPFGHGLSYSEFKYSNLDAFFENDVLKISLDVENIGSLDANEIVQVYIGNPTSTVPRPVKELRAFEKVYIGAGEKKRVNFNIPASELGYFNTMLDGFVTESGVYRVYVGASSTDIRLTSDAVYECEMPYTMSAYGLATVG